VREVARQFEYRFQIEGEMGGWNGAQLCGCAYEITSLLDKGRAVGALPVSLLMGLT
jgi:hypothetical protein